jgi:ABC-type multidrug transport system ATPase subunit
VSAETAGIGLSKRYGRWQPWVLDRLDVRFRPGTLSVVVGANGSGKSTLMRLLAGVSRPNRGVISRPESVGYVPERLPARLQMTGRTYLAHMGRLRALDRVRVAQRVEELAHRLQLAPGLDVPIGRLSKGNTRKVLLAQAFLVPEGLLLLDEPFSGLDPVATEGLIHELSTAAAAGATVVVTSHTGDRVCPVDDMLELVSGRIRAFEPHRGVSVRSGLATIELAAPAGAPRRPTPPDWMLPFQPKVADRGWCLSVAPGPPLDQLLVRGISDGWNVRRVAPPTAREVGEPGARSLADRRDGLRRGPDADAPGQ